MVYISYRRVAGYESSGDRDGYFSPQVMDSFAGRSSVVQTPVVPAVSIEPELEDDLSFGLRFLCLDGAFSLNELASGQMELHFTQPASIQHERSQGSVSRLTFPVHALDMDAVREGPTTGAIYRGNSILAGTFTVQTVEFEGEEPKTFLYLHNGVVISLQGADCQVFVGEFSLSSNGNLELMRGILYEKRDIGYAISKQVSLRLGGSLSYESHGSMTFFGESGVRSEYSGRFIYVGKGKFMLFNGRINEFDRDETAIDVWMYHLTLNQIQPPRLSGEISHTCTILPSFEMGDFMLSGNGFLLYNGESQRSGLDLRSHIDNYQLCIDDSEDHAMGCVSYDGITTVYDGAFIKIGCKWVLLNGDVTLKGERRFNYDLTINESGDCVGTISDLEKELTTTGSFELDLMGFTLGKCWRPKSVIGVSDC